MFDAMIKLNAVHYANLDCCDIFSDYLCLHIFQRIVDEEKTIEQWDLACYSVQHKISRC
jgi:hypothetical protein